MSKAAIVAGGLGVLGRAVVGALSRHGWTVAVVDLATGDPPEGAAFVIGGVDLSDEDAVERAYATATARAGPIGAVVNVAGGFVWDKVAGGDLANWDRMYRMNLRSAAASSRSALALFGVRGGAIVNIGAVAARAPRTGMAPYAASKAGVSALTESLADEGRSLGIRVNAVLPTIIDTPANRADMPDADHSDWLPPSAVAKVVVYLISDDAQAISGASIPLMSVAPGSTGGTS